MNTIGTKTIETARLTLRRYTVDDAPDMYNNWASDPEVTKFLSWPAHASVDFTRELLTKWVSFYDDGRTYNWGITLKGVTASEKLSGAKALCPRHSGP